MRNQTVAFFVNQFPKLSETFILNQITGLIDLGIDVKIIAIEEGYENKIHQSYYDYNLAERTTYLNRRKNQPRWKKLASRMFKLSKAALCGDFVSVRQVLNKHQPRNKLTSLYLADFLGTENHHSHYYLIIAHFGPNGYLATQLRTLGVFLGPIATVFHGFDMSEQRILNQYQKAYQTLFEQGDLMLPISNLWKERLISWGCNENKIRVHRMGVNLEQLPIRTPTQPLKKPLRVICIGRMTEKKGIEYAIEGVALASKYISVELNIIGGGELLPHVQSLIIQHQAQDYIHCLGPQTHQVVKEYLDSSDVFLLPSVTAPSGDMEGIPVALMESMACGLLTLTTRHSGIPELVDDGINGFLTDERNAQQIANKLLDISQLSQIEISAIRHSARKTIENTFNNYILNQELLSICKSFG